jgi:hypothetical protein
MPTVAQLAQSHGARFTFQCRPCGGDALAAWTGPQLVAKVGTEETFESLVKRTVCSKCRMPVDGVFRTFTFSCTSDPEKDAEAGMTQHGWSGPR